MRVRVLFFGVLKEAVGHSEETVEVAAPITVGEVFDSYRQRFATLDARRSSILFARNGEFTKAETTLSHGDEIAFLPPVSGGSESTDSRGFASITRDVIDARALSDSVRRNHDGAVVTFEGVVRDNTKGRGTLYLDYEAYQPLALSRMERIADEIARQFKVSQVSVVHRLGKLQIGEASVVIAVSAPHRRPAFEAALETIDRLKREVPIWKKEYFADGEVWVEGEWSDEMLSQRQTEEAR